MTNKTLLLSIRPKYATKIFGGEKKVELRKVKPQLSPGDVVLVYVSSPIKELQGKFIVEKVLEATPAELWNEVKNIAGVSKKEFNDYYSGSKKGFGIFLQVPQTINPISLVDLRKIWKNFHPPQSYRYLSNVELNMISSLP